jgi:YHS domain-containing protein
MTAHEDLNLTDASAGAGSCCGHAPSAAALAQTPAEEMAECRVMAGTPVVKADAEAAGLYRDYEGQRYWFCCAACGPRFDAEPERYAYAA